MEGRVAIGLDLAAAGPISTLKAVFLSFEHTSVPSFMECIDAIEAAAVIPHVRMMAEITLQTAEDAKKLGTLESDVLTLSLIAAIVKYSEEDTHPPLYVDMNARCYNRDRGKVRPCAKFMWLLLHAH